MCDDMYDGFEPYGTNDFDAGLSDDAFESYDELPLDQRILQDYPAPFDTGALYDLYSDCALCPRACHVNRNAGELGYCGASAKVHVARAALHYWEEPPISGDSGSGTVFFAHCQLQCVYCQNAQISRPHIDPEKNAWLKVNVSAQDLAQMFLNLESEGANNINLVSATQYTPTVVDALHIARSRGLKVPIVYNTGGYETVETLRLYNGLVDVYLADFKHYNSDAAKRYAHAPDYPRVVLKALDEMVAQTGAPEYEDLATGETIMTHGTIVRHLLLPGRGDEAERIVSYLGTEFGSRIVVSLMSQYIPLVNSDKYPEISMPVDSVDYDNLVDHACLFDFDECFIQDSDSADTGYIPDFSGQGLIGSPS